MQYLWTNINSRGITLVEVIVTIALMGVVFCPLISLFVFSQKINNESEAEFKSIQLAQSFMEEIKSMDIIPSCLFIYNTATGSFEREIEQTASDFGVRIIITPVRSMLYYVSIFIIDDCEVINTLEGTKIFK